MPKDYSMADFLASVDTAVMGRKTYEVILKMGGGGFGTSKMATFVFSRTMAPPSKCSGVTLVRDSPAAFVEKLRQSPGKHIWHMGGGELARAFLAADLVDELYIGVVPVLLGEGIPLFPAGFPQRDFSLVENKTYSKGMIALRYERAR
jgi:dihydrofolate reductase